MDGVQSLCNPMMVQNIVHNPRLVCILWIVRKIFHIPHNLWMVCNHCAIRCCCTTHGWCAICGWLEIYCTYVSTQSICVCWNRAMRTVQEQYAPLLEGTVELIVKCYAAVHYAKLLDSAAQVYNTCNHCIEQ